MAVASLRASITQPDPESLADPKTLARRFAAEALGTFALTLVAAGGLVISALSKGEVDHVSRAVAPGLLVMAFIYAFGDASGAHFNPAVTLAFAARRVFPLGLVPVYCVAQIVGACVAALLLLALFGDVRSLGATEPKLGVWPALVFEVVLTWMLVTVIVGTADRFRIVGTNAALAVGATIALCGLFAGPVGDASMNPARSLGPALVGGHLSNVWIYLVGPVVGSLLATATASLLHGESQHDSKTQEAAQGEESRPADGNARRDRGRAEGRENRREARGRRRATESSS